MEQSANLQNFNLVFLGSIDFLNHVVSSGGGSWEAAVYGGGKWYKKYPPACDQTFILLASEIADIAVVGRYNICDSVLIRLFI